MHPKIALKKQLDRLTAIEETLKRLEEKINYLAKELQSGRPNPHPR